MQTKEYALSEAMAVFRTQKINNFVDDNIKKSEFSVLILINESPSKLSAIDLSKYFNCTKVYIGKVLDSLEEKGLIEKEISRRDRRKYYLFTTELGKEVVKKHMMKYMETTKELYKRLGEEKSEQLIKMLNEASKILKDIEKEQLKNNKRKGD